MPFSENGLSENGLSENRKGELLIIIELCDFNNNDDTYNDGRILLSTSTGGSNPVQKSLII